MADFISASIDTDAGSLLATAVTNINATFAANGFPGWTVQDASLAVIILSIIAAMAADVAATAATVVPAIFRAFLTQMLNIPFVNGAAATVVSTFILTQEAPAGGLVIPANTPVTIDGVGFYSQLDVTVPEGVQSGQVLLVAVNAGQASNGLGGPGVSWPRVQLGDSIDWVAGVSLTAVTAGGADQQSDSDYLNKGTAALGLMAARPVKAPDFAAMVQSEWALQATGVAVGRATAIDNYYPAARALSTPASTGPVSIACTLESGSDVITIDSPDYTRTPVVGASATAAGIPVGAVVSSTTGDTVTLAATAWEPNTVYVVDQVFEFQGALYSVSTGYTSGDIFSATDTTNASAISAVNCTASGAATVVFSATSGYGPVPLACTVALTDAEAPVTISAGPYYGATPDPGARVIPAAGIPSGATVAATPAPTASGFSLSAEATATEADETIALSSWQNVARCVSVYVADDLGNPLTAADMDALASFLAGYRESSFLSFVTSPSYSLLYVGCQVKVLAGYDPTAVGTAVQNALLAYLSPATWGLDQSSGVWLTSGFSTVRLNKLIGVVESSVPGVDYVTNGGLTLGLESGPTGTSDVVLSGPLPLPTSSPGTVNGVGPTGSICVTTC